MDDLLRMQTDRGLRDAARSLVADDVNRIRRGLQRRSISGRVLDRTAEGAAEAVDELMAVVERHKAAAAAIAGGALIWFSRAPLMDFLKGNPSSDTENDDEQS